LGGGPGGGRAARPAGDERGAAGGRALDLGASLGAELVEEGVQGLLRVAPTHPRHPARGVADHHHRELLAAADT
jgi:hypothetical protein